jgi:hypothetical protein
VGFVEFFCSKLWNSSETPLTVLFSWRSEPVLLRYINGSQSLENDIHRRGTLSWQYENLSYKKEMGVIEPFLSLKIVIHTVYRGIMEI